MEHRLELGSQSYLQRCRVLVSSADGCFTDVLVAWRCWLCVQDVVEELFELLSTRQQDWKQIRTWVRQLQQHEQQRQEQQQGQPEQHQQQVVQQVQGAPAAQSDSVSAVAAQDPEVLQLIQELNASQQQAQTSSSSKSKGKSSKSPAATARRSIRRMLKPLALDRL